MTTIYILSVVKHLRVCVCYIQIWHFISMSVCLEHLQNLESAFMRQPCLLFGPLHYSYWPLL